MLVRSFPSGSVAATSRHSRAKFPIVFRPTRHGPATRSSLTRQTQGISRSTADECVSLKASTRRRRISSVVIVIERNLRSSFRVCRVRQHLLRSFPAPESLPAGVAARSRSVAAIARAAASVRFLARRVLRRRQILEGRWRSRRGLHLVRGNRSIGSIYGPKPA
jgi:hypothetical protein